MRRAAPSDASGSPLAPSPQGDAGVEVPPQPLPTRILAIKLVLLLLWLGVSFVPAFFASSLNREVWGWPLHYWIGAQGSVIGFLLIIVVDAAVMNRWEQRGRDDGAGD